MECGIRMKVPALKKLLLSMETSGFRFFHEESFSLITNMGWIWNVARRCMVVRFIALLSATFLFAPLTKVSAETASTHSADDQDLCLKSNVAQACYRASSKAFNQSFTSSGNQKLRETAMA